MASAEERRFDDVADEIRVIVCRTGLDRILAIGALVLNRFFEGSVTSWRSRRRHKNNSVHRLAARPGCPLSRSSLSDAIGVYVVTREIPWVLRGNRLGASHIVVVLPLAREQQERWLRRADDERWSVRQLRDAVRTSRLAVGEQRARPRGLDGRRAIARSLTTIGRLEDAVALLLPAGRVRVGDRDVTALESRLAGLYSRLRDLSGEECAAPRARQWMPVARRLVTG